MKRFGLSTMVMALVLMYSGMASAHNCCDAHLGLGCTDAYIEWCVCYEDEYCCEVEWDEYCVDSVTEYQCGTCGVEEDEVCPGYSSETYCCVMSDPCGWAADGYCDCEGTCPWDGDDCSGGGDPYCGDGICSEFETCSNCAVDCGECPYCFGYTGSSYCCTEENPCGWDVDGYCDCEGTCSWDISDCDTQEPCGDGFCSQDEDCITCPDDCGSCVGTGDCCEVQFTPGCNDAVVVSCVCIEDPYCCNTTWDSYCVVQVDALGCGDCGTGDSCGDGFCAGTETCQSCPADCGACPVVGDCCEAHQAPGCSNPTIQACVCLQDQFCCNYGWDSTCVTQVDTFGCGSCTGGPNCGDGLCNGIEDCLTCPEDCGECMDLDCCSPHDSPGCLDAVVQACVCTEDAFCCDIRWDGYCVLQVDSLQCGHCGTGIVCGDGTCSAGETCWSCVQDCGPCPGQGPCCEAHGTWGCIDPVVQGCVCLQDSYCCSIEWDQTCVDNVEAFDCGNCSPCIPDCVNRKCGPDGCGGVCGTCQGNESCQDGQCIPGCTAQCDGKECGEDGCGGFCGECNAGFQCVTGKCQPVCLPDCQGKQCGSDGCGGNCGTCPANFFCDQGHCASSCQPNCAGLQCGGDGCGGSCGICPDGMYCNNGHCASVCQPDCAGKQCGPDGCGGTCGTCQGGWFCQQGHCMQECVPDCAGKQCGSDGCQGSCGSCAPGAHCNLQGHCVSDCVPDCAGKQCGTDGCLGSCGSCAAGTACQEGVCVATCTPNCTGKQCGSDGCQGSCGTCTAGRECIDGMCTGCLPDCNGKECGDDGCGNQCGPCDKDETCQAGQCVYTGSSTVDVSGESDVVEGNECDPGFYMLMGKCVAEAPADPEKSVSSGSCSHSSPVPSLGWVPVLLFLAAVMSLRRRHRYAKFSLDLTDR